MLIEKHRVGMDHTVSKTRLKFSNLKIARKNTLNIFFVFSSKK